MEENISKTIRDDLILFKNDTLKDIKQTERILLDKYKNVEFTINEKIDNFKKQINLFNDKIIEITTFLDSLKDIKNSINTLLEHKTKSENSLIDLDIKLKCLDKECHDSLYNISNILKNSVIYPGIIGSTSKFKTFHHFIDYILNHITHAKQFKERIIKEVNDNRIKQDNNMDKLRSSYDLLLDRTKSLINNEIKEINEKNKSIFNLYDEKFQNFRLDNVKFDMSIKNMENTVNNIHEKSNEINNKESDLSIKFNDLDQICNHNKSEITSLKEKFYSLSNHLKQIKMNSYKNENIENNDLNIMKNNQFDYENTPFEELSSSNKELLKIKFKKRESGLRAYINGKININQLQSINKLNYKSLESFKNNIENEEDKNKKYYYSEKSKTFQTFPFFREDQKILLKKENTNKRNIQQIKIENNNSYNDTTNSNQNIDNYMKINAISPKIKSNNKTFQKIRQFNNISLNIEGEELLNINPKNKNNKKYKNIIENVKNILYKSNSNNNSFKVNYVIGYPRIMTNQGERIIISSHPVYHRHKFTKKEDPDILSLNKNIQKIYNNNNNKENKIIIDSNKKI